MEDNYGLVDKRTARVKRNISLIRIKLGLIDEALQEMKEVEVSLHPSHSRIALSSTLTKLVMSRYRSLRIHCMETAR